MGIAASSSDPERAVIAPPCAAQSAPADLLGSHSVEPSEFALGTTISAENGPLKPATHAPVQGESRTRDPATPPAPELSSPVAVDRPQNWPGLGRVAAVAVIAVFGLLVGGCPLPRKVHASRAAPSEHESLRRGLAEGPQLLQPTGAWRFLTVSSPESYALPRGWLDWQRIRGLWPAANGFGESGVHAGVVWDVRTTSAAHAYAAAAESGGMVSSWEVDEDGDSDRLPGGCASLMAVTWPIVSLTVLAVRLTVAAAGADGPSWHERLETALPAPVPAWLGAAPSMLGSFLPPWAAAACGVGAFVCGRAACMVLDVAAGLAVAVMVTAARHTPSSPLLLA